MAKRKRGRSSGGAEESSPPVPNGLFIDAIEQGNLMRFRELAYALGDWVRRALLFTLGVVANSQRSAILRAFKAGLEGKPLP